MNDVTFQILKIAISACAILVTIYACPYLYQLRNNERYSQLVDLVGVAVRAAEQTIKASGQGAVKKERVMDFIREYLGERGTSITWEQLSELVEAAVYQLKRGGDR